MKKVLSILFAGLMFIGLATTAAFAENLIDVHPPYAATGGYQDALYYPSNKSDFIKMGGDEYKNSISIIGRITKVLVIRQQLTSMEMANL